MGASSYLIDSERGGHPSLIMPAKHAKLESGGTVDDAVDASSAVVFFNAAELMPVSRSCIRTYRERELARE